MTDERAMEILNPKHREHYDSIETVNEACRMGMNAIKRVKELEAENAELKERLSKAVELPCEVGTGSVVYALCGRIIEEFGVVEILITEYGVFIIAYNNGNWTFSMQDYNKTWFTDRTKAEEFCKLKKTGE